MTDKNGTRWLHLNLKGMKFLSNFKEESFSRSKRMSHISLLKQTDQHVLVKKEKVELIFTILTIDLRPKILNHLCFLNANIVFLILQGKSFYPDCRNSMIDWPLKKELKNSILDGNYFKIWIDFLVIVFLIKFFKFSVFEMFELSEHD